MSVIYFSRERFSLPSPLLGYWLSSQKQFPLRWQQARSSTSSERGLRSWHISRHRSLRTMRISNTHNDLFFSGHVGLPFLVALIFWRYTYLRYYFLLFALIASVTVLLGHLHYSIDVFSAFFITYGIFEIAKRFFKKEYRLYIKEWHGILFYLNTDL